MIDVSDRVFSNIKKKVSTMCTNVQADATKTPAIFPALSVVQIDNADVALDLEISENAISSVIEIQSYSNIGIHEAKKLINMACDGMRIMGYVRTYGPREIENPVDVNVKRMVARFSRIVGAGEEIEKIV